MKSTAWSWLSHLYSDSASLSSYCLICLLLRNGASFHCSRCLFLFLEPVTATFRWCCFKWAIVFDILPGFSWFRPDKDELCQPRLIACLHLYCSLLKTVMFPNSTPKENEAFTNVKLLGTSKQLVQSAVELEFNSVLHHYCCSQQI